MEQNEARDQLNSVRRAQRDSARPPLSAAVTVAAAVCAGVGVALLGRPTSDAFLVTRALALVLIAVAYLLPTWIRKRHGLNGYEGHVRQTNIVWLLSLVTLFVCGLTADSTLSIIYIGLGIVAGVTYFLALRGWGMPK